MLEITARMVQMYRSPMSQVVEWRVGQEERFVEAAERARTSDRNYAGLNGDHNCFSPVSHFKLLGDMVQVISDRELA